MPQYRDWNQDWKSRGDIYEGEHDDIHEEVRRVLDTEADGWLHEPNVRFGGRTPEQVIQDGEQYWVRDVLRSYEHGGMS